MRSVVLWDVGGTLVVDTMSKDEFVRRCLAAAGISLEQLTPDSLRSAEEVRSRLEPHWRTVEDEAAGRREIAAALLSDSPATDDQVSRVAAGWQNYYDIYQPVPGIRSILNELKNMNVVQGVVSNWPPSLRAFLDHHDLGRYFKVIAGSGELGVEKPDRAIFRHALSRLGVSASDCVFIGDNPENDVEPARELGMKAIHFDPRGSWPEADARDAQQLRRHLMRILRGN